MTTSKKSSILGNWGEQAYELLSAIRYTGHTTKKKLTILALADAVYTNISINRVLKHNPDTASKTAHYKWLDNDAAYKAAYDFLVGNLAPDAPEAERGLARRRREAEFDEDALTAVIKVESARVKLDMLSLRAVQVYEDALGANLIDVVGNDEEAGPITYESPDHRTRLIAANAIADRVPKLAKNKAVQVTADIDVSKLTDEELDELDDNL